MENLVTYTQKQEAIEAVLLAVGNALAQNSDCTVLAPAYPEVVRIKKELACAEIGFGVTVLTPHDWMLDLWETWGDDRRVVPPVDRDLFMRKAIRLCLDEGSSQLEVTSGMVNFLGRIAREALPVALEGLQDDAWSQRERDALQCLACYDALLAQHQLLEESTALFQLSHMSVIDGCDVVVYDCMTSALQERLLERAKTQRVEIAQGLGLVGNPPANELDALRAYLYRPDAAHPVMPEGAVTFAFPEGRYSQARLLSKQVIDTVKLLRGKGASSPRMALAAKHPAAMFGDIAPLLSQCGVQVQVEDGVLFRDTAFGKSWIALLSFLEGEDWSKAGLGFIRASLAGDYCLSPFSSMSVRQAQSLNVRFRGWRGQPLDEALTDMVAFTFDDCRGFLEAIEEGNIQKALSLQEQGIAARTSWPEAYRIQQLSAVKKAQSVHGRGEFLGLSLQDTLDCLANVVVGVSSVWPVEDCKATLFIGSLPRVGSSMPREYDAVFVSDLTADAYSLKDDMRAHDLLLDKLGCYRPRSKSAQLHRYFAESLNAARYRVTLSRCLHGVDAEELRPAALLEELIDCYRADPQNPDEVHKVLGLPDSLLPYAVTLGEEAVSCNLAQALDGPSEKVIKPALESLAAIRHDPRLVPAHPLCPLGEENIVLSPSSLESFCECPFKWFADRRLGLGAPDADFGVRAFGSFAHSVLEHTHKELTQMGLRRVTQETLPEATQIMHDVFARLFQEEQMRISNDALIPLSHVDMLEVEHLRRTLDCYLRWEVNLLPQYYPYKVELTFGEGNLVEYAGVYLQGRLDRVDVDGFGHAVVIDYKTSVSSSHALRARDAQEWIIPRKIQALVYAQVIRRKLGYIPTGALYVSYRKPQVMGAYDRNFLGPQALPGINADLCGSRCFLDELDRCEEYLAGIVEQMRAGDIVPQPVDDGACKYCPVTQCPGRCG